MNSIWEYDLLFGGEALAFFVSSPKRVQRQLLDGAVSLAESPFIEPDWVAQDARGRTVFQIALGGYVFDYHVDHAARAVIVTAIEKIYFRRE